MKRVIVLVAAAIVSGACAEPKPATPAAPVAAAPVAAPVASAPAAPAKVAPTKLPDGPGAQLVMGRCLICHTEQYVLQQRLTEGQWAKTVGKMKGWGAPVSDEEAAQLTAYLAASFGTDVPDLPRVLVPKPGGT